MTTNTWLDQISHFFTKLNCPLSHYEAGIGWPGKEVSQAGQWEGPGRRSARLDGGKAREGG